MHEVTFSGWSVTCAYAENFSALIAGLTEGRCVTGKPWFSNPDDQQRMHMAINPRYVPHVSSIGSVEERIIRVVNDALTMAGLSAEALRGPRVRVYMPSIGMRADMRHYLGYQDRNDSEDLLFFPQIKQLHAREFADDRLTHALAQRWDLNWPPMTINCASNSSMAALHLAHQAIAAGEADLALLVGWTEFMQQDVQFLGGQNMLSEAPSQPFSQSHSSVTLADGVMALIVENTQCLRERGKKPRVMQRSSVSYQSSGARGGSSFSADFRSIIRILEQAMAAAGVTADRVACMMPHGNGIQTSDKSEAMALLKIWGEKGVPVVSYKGQIGYFSTCSGLLDLMIACDALEKGRLLAFTTRHPLDNSTQLNFHADNPPLTLEKNVIVKSGMGLDGSVIATVLEAPVENPS